MFLEVSWNVVRVDAIISG